MSREDAIRSVKNNVDSILNIAADKVQSFLDGKAPEKYGSTIIAQEIIKEFGFNQTLTTALVSLYIKNDNRVKSSKGRIPGKSGLQKV